MILLWNLGTDNLSAYTMEYDGIMSTEFCGVSVRAPFVPGTDLDMETARTE